MTSSSQLVPGHSRWTSWTRGNFEFAALKVNGEAWSDENRRSFRQGRMQQAESLDRCRSAFAVSLCDSDIRGGNSPACNAL